MTIIIPRRIIHCKSWSWLELHAAWLKQTSVSVSIMNIKIRVFYHSSVGKIKIIFVLNHGYIYTHVDCGAGIALFNWFCTKELGLSENANALVKFPLYIMYVQRIFCFIMRLHDGSYLRGLGSHFHPV